MKENKHIGIYGIATNDNKILVIKKSRGPYKGTFDLPGGGIEFCEDLMGSIKREFLEEIGVEINVKSLISNEDCTSNWIDDGVDTKTHHIGLYYEVELQDYNIKTEADGHDSNGALWLDIAKINEETVSPIAFKALKKYLLNI